jgi:circadian clock protein KaiC
MTDVARGEEVGRTNGIAGQELAKSATGIQGLDEITGGGLPTGRATLMCGSAGCGKTLLSLEFLVLGAVEFGENGVLLAFEETAEELSQNVRSLGFDLDQLIEDGKLVVDYVHIDRSEIDETGEYDLEGLFIRLADAIDRVGAKRVVLDTIESLFSGLSNDAILRSELRRLFRWLKERGVTAIITGERGEKSLTRQGLEEYVSDCVILLDHRVSDQLSTRRLRVVKYRGSTHGTNEYPFLIDQFGISVLPITSLGLKHGVTNERISTGVSGLDAMLGGKGVYRASSILISGTAGTGKTTVSAHFADAACRRGERCLYFAFEESPNQIVRNMRSVGIDLQQWVDRGLLMIHSSRPSMYGLETHLTTMYREARAFNPRLVMMDPITSFLRSDGGADAEAMLVRMIDFLKGCEITSVFTSLTGGGSALDQSEVGVSSLIDTWLVVKEIEQQGERNRGLYVIKSRGMSHSEQIREFLLTDEGVQLKDAYIGPGGVLTGSARLAQEAREEAAKVKRQEDIERKQRSLERKRQVMDAQIATLRAEFEAEEQEAQRMLAEDQRREERLEEDKEDMARSRKADPQPQKAQEPT